MFKQIIVAAFATFFVATSTTLMAADMPPVKTVAQVFAQKNELSGQKVHLSGKVVKVNNDIMGKNFIHIQDGTGAEGSNDITVTSQQTAKVGDEVELDAVVITDRDFGMGYSYPVILEEATLSKVSH